MLFSLEQGDLYPVLDDCTMKKTLDFYAWVLIDVDMPSSLPQQMVEHLSFAFMAKVNYERLPPFFSYYKMTSLVLFTCKHYPQSDRYD